jgi:hypothetical protein
MAAANSACSANGAHADAPTGQTLAVIGTRPFTMPSISLSVVTGPITSEPSS